MNSVVVQSLNHVQLFATPCKACKAACQASLSFTISWSLLKFVSFESMMPSNHLILCRPLLLSPSVFPSIRVFSNKSARHIRQPKYWSFSFSISLGDYTYYYCLFLNLLDVDLLTFLLILTYVKTGIISHSYYRTLQKLYVLSK